MQDLIKSMHLILCTALPCFENPLPKKTRLETKNVPPIPPHFLQRWWCKWWLYNVHIMRRNQVLSQPWEVVCWILHGKECLRQPNNIYFSLYIINRIYISLKKSSKRHKHVWITCLTQTCLNVWKDNLYNIYYTLYIIYKIDISLKKARRGTNRWRVHWCRTRAHNGDTRLNVRSEEPAGVRWWFFFSMGTFFTSRYSLLEERKGYLFWDVFLTRWKKWLLQETFASARTTPRGPHSPHHARQHITCVLIIS